MKVAVSISQQQNNQELQFNLLGPLQQIKTIVEMRENNQSYSAQKNPPTTMGNPEQPNYTNLPNNYNSYAQQPPYNLNYPYPYYQPQNYQYQPIPHPNYQYYNSAYGQYHQPPQPPQPQFMPDPANPYPNWKREGNYSQYQNNQKIDKNNNGDKPYDPRRRNNDPKDKKPARQPEQQKQPRKEKTYAYTQKNLKNNDSQIENQSYGSDSHKQSQSQDEQVLYQKSKTILKKRDPILDTPQQIKKWIEARKRNYPIFGRSKVAPNTIEGEMSILQSKIRKKIMLVTSDGRGLMKKLKNMHILKRLVGQTQPQLVKNKPNKITKQKVRLIKQGKKKQKLQQKALLKQSTVDQGDNKEIGEINEVSNDESAPLQKPIVKEPIDKNQQVNKIKIGQELDCTNTKIRGGLTPEDMINHLRQKQKQDKDFFDQLLSYRTNSLNYKYSSQTLETNFVLEDIFEESSYLLQIIRYIAKNDFFNANS